MFNTIKKIIKYPNLTQNYPRIPLPVLPKTGKPVIDMEKCTGCGECLRRCPSQAIVRDEKTDALGINLDTCVFCTLCEEICPAGAIEMTNQIELAENQRTELRSSTLVVKEDQEIAMPYEAICDKLVKRIGKTFGRSLNIREVDAGSCNGCDYEINALNNPFNDVERLGMHFVASPRHADMLLVTGTASRNMQLALIKTYNATPDPKLVVAVGACACSGGIFRDSYATSNGIDGIVPVDVYIPGCPPRPQAILYGILKAIEKG